MLREKLYERKNWGGVVHTTWNPNGPGVIRIHMIPPKFRWFRTEPSVVILNGQDILPIGESWAILLTEFIRGINEFGSGQMDDGILSGIMEDAFHRVRAVYPEADDSTLRADLLTIVGVFEDIARGKIPTEEIGILNLQEYAPEMTAPHRMDLMVSSMTREGNWHCNQRCVHCYAAGQEMASVPELGTAEWKKIIDRCREARIPQLTFTGGEPTLREDLPELIAHARWFVTRLNTNGVLLTPELVTRLREAELDSVQVTLYSDDEEIHNTLVGAGNWKRTTDGIRNALAAGMNLSVNTPLCSLNRSYPKMLEFLHSAGVRYVTCSGLIVTGNAERAISRETQLSTEEITEIVTAAAEFAYSHDMEISFTSPGWIPDEKLRAAGLDVPMCGACLSNMAVTPDGKAVPCQSWLSGEPLGDMLRDSWKRIWNSAAARERRRESAEMKGICPLRKAD